MKSKIKYLNFLKVLGTIGICLMLTLTNIPLSIFAVENEDLIETIVDDGSIGTGMNQVSYGGNWQAGPNPACEKGTEHYTRPQDSDWGAVKPSLSIKFTGVKVELYGQTSPALGKYKISLDGNELDQEIDAYSGSTENKVLLFESEKLVNKEHVIVMTMKNTKNSSSTKTDGHFDFAKVFSPKTVAEGISISNGNFSLEAGLSKNLTTQITPTGAVADGILWTSSDSSVASVDKDGKVVANKNGTTNIKAQLLNTEIYSDPIVVTVTGNEESNFIDMIDDNEASTIGLKFTYENNWGIDTGIGNQYNGSNHWSTAGGVGSNQAKASLSFYGKGIAVYGNKDSGNGIYAIYIDEELVGEVDAYKAGGRAYKQLLYETKTLEEGVHTVRIETTEKKNPASTGYEISVDYAKVWRDDKDIKATDFKIANSSMQLDMGSKQTLDVTYTPTFATDKSATWTSSDDGIVSVDENGVVTAKKIGEVVITGLLANGKSQQIRIKVIANDYKVRAMFGNTNVHYLQDDYDKIQKKYLTENEKYSSSYGWKGDRINAEIVAWTKDVAVSNLKVTPKGFATENGISFSEENISIDFLKTTSVGKGRAGQIAGAPHIDIPDIIYGGDIKTLAAKSVQNAWISIDIPEDTSPGVYSGTISVSAGEMDTPIVLPYTFEVFDLKQPTYEENQGGVEIWQYPYAVAKYYNIPDDELYGEKHLKLLEQNIKEYKAAGGNVITTAITDYPWARNNPYDYPSTIKWIKKADGTFKFDFTQFDAWVGLNVKNGIDDKLKLFSMVPYWSMRYYNEGTGQYEEENLQNQVGGTRWKAVWGQFLDAFIPHLDEKGWFDMAYSSMDEVGLDKADAVATLLADHPNKDNKIMKVSAAVNYSGGDTSPIMDKINDVSIALSHIPADTKTFTNSRREKGLYTSFYTCTGIYPNSFGLSDPGESAWTMWYTSTYDFDGYLRWAGDNWLSEPYKNLDWNSWESGDTMLFYPDDNKNADSPSIHSTPRWEKMKEGKRDVEKMFYLRDNYPELTDEINTLLYGIGRKNGVNDGYGGTYADSQETKDYIENEVVKLREGLKKFSNLAATSTTIPVTDIQVTSSAITLNVGESNTITPTVLPENATDKTLTWTSAAPDIATVANGVITAVKAGTTTVTVKNEASGVKKEITVTVKAKVIAVESIEVSNEEATLTVGESTTITANVLPANATDKTLTWKSSDTKIATVTNGKITAKKAGKVEISVTTEDGKIKKVIKITVNDKVVVPEDQDEIKNQVGDVTVIGKFPSTITLVTTAFNESEEAELAKKVIDMNKTYFAKNTIERILDIKLLNGKVEYQPNGDVSVKTKLDKELLGKKLKVLRILDDGKTTELKSSVENGYIVFVTDHFSKFAIVSEKGTIIDNDKEDGPNTPTTGDTTNVAGWMMLAILTGGVLLGLKKRNNKKVTKA